MTETSNAALQLEEIEALRAIYGKQWEYDGNKTLTFIADIEDSKSIVLTVRLGDNYPLTEPPYFEISSPYLGKTEKEEITGKLQDEYMNNLGAPVLYQWSEILRHYANDLRKATLKPHSSSSVEIPKGRSVTDLCVEESYTARCEPPVIHTGEPLTDRKSTFQASVCPVKSRAEVQRALETLKSDKKVSRATHNMYAYRITLDGKRFIQDCDDDGEHHAGSRLLHLLEITDARNVLVVVSRWYGGVQLGADRFKHINNVARTLLESCGYIKYRNK
ncbi:unnamed protein product [Soboliphyme baturini]|uniref:RWD domain-containing protein n=1 Tax=Soboliphyme baturini TaxID=241478 RepID=A0A183IG59_9BILA|nr:unnamed protein product [Soboliphyme baturini]